MWRWPAVWVILVSGACRGPHTPPSDQARATEPATEPASKPATEPASKPATEPATKRATAPVAFLNPGCDADSAAPKSRPRPPEDRPKLQPLPMVGPFREITDYCCGPIMEVNEDESPTCRLEDGFHIPMAGPKATAASTGPIKSARLIAVEGLDVDCRVAIQLDAGWYVQEPGFYCGSERSKSTWEHTVTRFEIADLLPGGAPEVVLAYRALQSLVDYDPSELDEDQRDYLQVCGVGASGIPSSLSEFVVAGLDGRDLMPRYDDDGNKLSTKPKISRSFRYQVRYQADSIQVTDPAGKVVLGGDVRFP